MKKYSIFAIILVLTVSLLAGCRNPNTEPSTLPSTEGLTMPTTMPATEPVTVPTTMPETETGTAGTDTMDPSAQTGDGMMDEGTEGESTGTDATTEGRSRGRMPRMK